MKKSLYLLIALVVIGNTTFSETTLTEETYNSQTEVLSEIVIPQDNKWYFTGRLYLETEDIQNSSKVRRVTNKMEKVGNSEDGLFLGTGVVASRDRLTLDLNVERRYNGDVYSFKESTRDMTKVDWKVKYQLFEKQGFHIKYRNEQADNFRRDRIELGTDWNYYENMFTGWAVIGHDKDKSDGKHLKGNFWEFEFGPTFSLTEKLSINPTIYNIGEFYDNYEMVETQIRIMAPYVINEKLTIMPRIRLTLDKNVDDKIDGDYKKSWEATFGNRIRYELMANYIINEDFSTFISIGYENEKRDFENSKYFGGVNGKQSHNMWCGYIGLTYKFN